MNDSFDQIWKINFPSKVPIPDLFKFYFSKSWLRIHSFQDSKRYAETKKDHQNLLTLQNKIISDCFGKNTPIFIVAGHYSPIIYNLEEKALYDWLSAKEINLHAIDPENFDDKDLNYTPKYIQTIWETNRYNILLKKIANDETKAFFISFEKQIIIAPYDGGLDLIIQDDDLRKQLECKYHNFLSLRIDRL